MAFRRPRAPFFVPEESLNRWMAARLRETRLPVVEERETRTHERKGLWPKNIAKTVETEKAARRVD